MDYQKLADLLYPNIQKTPEYWERKYHMRDLPKGAEVTRFAPSPTGFLHIGGLFTCLINKFLAQKSNGIFYLRIEDTDDKRLVEGSINTIIHGLDRYGLTFDEGRVSNTEDKGEYAPYLQSERVEIYQTFAKALVAKGMAYPCFCTADDLAEMRSIQESKKEQIGYYGTYAKCRDLSFEDISNRLANGQKFVLRFRCPYKDGDKMTTHDLLRGERIIPANTNDVIIMKSNGVPPYNFAHAIDDHLMRTTLVVRGEEWLPSLSEHLQLFEALGFTPPRYMHLSTIQKIDPDTGERRKLSKRKDPETDITYFERDGYPVQAVLEYLLTLANSNFENWRMQNPNAPIPTFDFKIDKMSSSGALFDLIKLNDISKNVISKLNAQDVYALALTWSKMYDPDFYVILLNNESYYIDILNIDRDIPKPRKDIAKMSEIKDTYDYMFQKGYLPGRGYDASTVVFPDKFSTDIISTVLTEYPKIYNSSDDQTVWFDKIKDFSEKLGYAREVKDYKKAPDNYPGHCGDISTIIRVALTGRTMTPNLYYICKLLGKEEIAYRFNELLNCISK